MASIEIIGTPLYQWESGRKLRITPLRGMTIDSVHFYNYGDSEALVVKPKEEKGKIIAYIPNILLQDDQNIVVCAVNITPDKIETIRDCVFPVRKRAKPSSYVYTETEVLNYASLDKRIDQLEGEGLANAVADYLKENPVQAGATAEQAQQINQNKADIEKLSTDKLDADKLPEAVNTALAQAKESGLFDGKPGSDGLDGKDGEPGPAGADGPPGDDYVLTDADRQEIAELAAGLVEVPSGGSLKWELLTDIELAEESAISPISYDAKKYSTVHARLIVPKVAEKIALTNNFFLLHPYGLYWVNVGDPIYGTCIDLRCEIMGAYMMEFFSNRPMSGIGNYANLQTRTSQIAAPIKFECGGTAVFPAGTKLTVWGRT